MCFVQMQDDAIKSVDAGKPACSVISICCHGLTYENTAKFWRPLDKKMSMRKRRKKIDQSMGIIEDLKGEKCQ